MLLMTRLSRSASIFADSVTPTEAVLVLPTMPIGPLMPTPCASMVSEQRANPLMSLVTPCEVRMSTLSLPLMSAWPVPVFGSPPSSGEPRMKKRYTTPPIAGGLGARQVRAAAALAQRRNEPQRGSSPERFKLKQQRQEEEEKAKRRQEEMQAAAKILAQKWAAEDSKKKSKKRSRSRSRRRRRGDEDAREDGGGREEGRGDGGARREASEEEREGGWVQMPRKEEPKLEPARSSPSRTFREQGPPRAVGSRGGGWASIDEPEREAPRPITGGAAGLAGGAPLAQRGAAGPAGSAARKERLARVFAFGDEEDDEEARRREVELAEKSKKSKLSVEAQSRPLSSSAAMSGIRTPLPDAGGGAVDMCSQLMKMAEWKRKCGGKRVPMPEDMKASVARAMGGAPL
ncbi:unnamed protein product [Prorocentrum cordatum]|uniref:Ribosome biogenesis protein NOP53 n=1 Tax=Prorocentrum cordatum TaxID=2364126 RepID=A0ABN9R784_9DINO|nr:unnamed protein product [Polarella glacialis]